MDGKAFLYTFLQCFAFYKTAVGNVGHPARESVNQLLIADTAFVLKISNWKLTMSGKIAS